MDTKVGSGMLPIYPKVGQKSVVLHRKSELEYSINSIETVATSRVEAEGGKVSKQQEMGIGTEDVHNVEGVLHSLREGGHPPLCVPVASPTHEHDVYKPRYVIPKAFGDPSGGTEVYQSVKKPMLHSYKGSGATLQFTEIKEAEQSLSKLSLKANDSNVGSGHIPMGNLNSDMLNAKATTYASLATSTKNGGQQNDITKANDYESSFMRKRRDFAAAMRQTSAAHVIPMAHASARSKPSTFWHKPFAKKRGALMHFMGMPLIETVNPGAQKSWHLEAISALTREQYASLKMTMLRLTKSNTNLDPNVLMILSRSKWEVLQQGTFGTVYVGFVERMGHCAVKIPVPDMVQHDPVGVMRRYINEWDILSRCSHPNIVKLYGGLIFGVFDLWLCTELIGGADLHSIKYDNYRKREITPRAGLKMCRQLADAIRYLHTITPERGEVVHRDIKPENIIVMENWDIKLCDFGDANESSNAQDDNISGATWLYAPPELLTHKSVIIDILGMDNCDFPQQGNLSSKWDIWSMGCVFQEMLGYYGPFHHMVDISDTPSQICQKMVANAMKGLVPSIPPVLARTRIGRLISQCLSNDPSQRPTAEQICSILRAPDAILLS